MSLSFLRWISLLALLVVSPAFAEWTVEDTKYELAYMALNVLDYKQTKQIAKNPGQYYEYNPILGRHPSVGDVDKYFLISSVMHPLVAYWMHDKYRDWFHGMTLAIKAVCVIRNYQIGLKVRF